MKSDANNEIINITIQLFRALTSCKTGYCRASIGGMRCAKGMCICVCGEGRGRGRSCQHVDSGWQSELPSPPFSFFLNQGANESNDGEGKSGN